MLDMIRKRFESTLEVRQLRTQQQYLQRSMRFSDALAVGKQIEALFVVCLNQYMEKAENEVMTLDTESSDIPLKDKDEMMEKIMVMFMCCDIIDSAILDMNDILHRTKPDVDITTFDDIKQISEMAREKLKFLQENGDYMQDLVWADKCDNMYSVMSSKAKAIIRKRKEDRNWGSNMKAAAGM